MSKEKRMLVIFYYHGIQNTPCGNSYPAVGEKINPAIIIL